MFLNKLDDFTCYNFSLSISSWDKNGYLKDEMLKI